MTRLIRALLLLLLAAGQLPTMAGAAPASPIQLTGTVTWVYDADTLEIAPHGKVRLLGIDAPERGDSDRDRGFVKRGIEAGRLRPVHGEGLAWCMRHVKGQTVTLTFDRNAQDRYERMLAYVRLPDGRLLNRVLLEEGLVIVYRRFPIELMQDFLAAEARAKSRGVGLWAHRRPAPAPQAPHHEYNKE